MGSFPGQMGSCLSKISVTPAHRKLHLPGDQSNSIAIEYTHSVWQYWLHRTVSQVLIARRHIASTLLSQQSHHQIPGAFCAVMRPGCPSLNRCDLGCQKACPAGQSLTSRQSDFYRSGAVLQHAFTSSDLVKRRHLRLTTRLGAKKVTLSTAVFFAQGPVAFRGPSSPLPLYTRWNE